LPPGNTYPSARSWNVAFPYASVLLGFNVCKNSLCWFMPSIHKTFNH
jgi:hypothetical protein